MKIIRKLLMLFIIMFALCSCTISKITIELDPTIETYVLIDKDELQTKMNNQDDFLLYIYSDSCLGCKDFKPILNSYIKDSDAKIYAIETRNLPSNNNLVEWSTTPSLAVLNNGKTMEIADGINNSKVFASKENLNEFINKYVEFNYTNIDITSSDEEIENYSISKTLDQMILNKETFIIYYHWNDCGDCKYFEENFLNKWNKENKDIKYYSVEVGYYFDNFELYEGFTKKYGLHSEANATYGYKKGVVPMFQYYEEGSLKDSLVIFNDETNKQKDEDGIVTSVTITNSFYADAPHINKTYHATKDESAMSLYRKDTLTFYINKFKDFMNK